MKKVWQTLRTFPAGAITAEVQGEGCLAIDYPNQRRIFSIRGKDLLELPVLAAPGDARVLYCTSEGESFYSEGGFLRKGLNETALVSSLDTTACAALIPYDGGLALVFATEVVLVSYGDLSVIGKIKVKLTNPECSSYCASSGRLLITNKSKFFLLDTDLKKVVYRGKSPRHENIDNCWTFGDLAVLATKSFVQILYIGAKLGLYLPTQSAFSSSFTTTDSASNNSSSSGISWPLSLPLSDSTSDLLWNPVKSIIPVPYPVTCSLIVGERLIVGNIIGGVDYYDIESGSHILSRKVREGLGLFVVLSLNCLGDFLIVMTSDGELMLYHLYEKEQEKPFIVISLMPLSCCFFTNNQLYAVDYNCTSLYHWAPNYKLIQQAYAKSRFQVIHKEAPKNFKGKLHAFTEWLFKAKEKPGDLAAFIDKVNACFAQQYPEIGDIYQPCTITNPCLPDNPIMYVNDSFVELTGYDREEIEGVNCRFLQGKFSDTEDVRLLSEKIKTEQPHYAELLNYTKDGKPFWNNFACLPVHEGNKLIAFVAVQNDISMIKLDTDPREWNAVEVALFIADSGFHFCSPLFISCGVCGKRLLQMKKGDLEALGVPPDYVDKLYRLIKDRFMLNTIPKQITSRSHLLTELQTDENSELESIDKFPVLVFDDQKTVSTPRSIAFTQDGEDHNHHEFEIDIRSKNVRNKKSLVLIGILPESMSWNQKNFALLKGLHQPLYQTYFAGDKGHLNFIGSKPKKNDKDFPVVVVSVVRKGHKAYFAKQTPLGYQQWSTNISNLVSKSGALDSKQVQKYLVRRFGFDKWKQISNDPIAITKLCMIDNIRSKVLTFGLGVLFRKKGQTTRKEIFSNQLSVKENKRFSRFLNLMEVGDHIIDETVNPERSSTWREKKIYWNLSPELTKDQQRQYIGNSLAVLIFNDGQDTFDPLEIELGSVTCIVAVITPVEKKFRLDFYFHYIVDLAPSSKNYEAPTIPKVEIPPEVPHNYLFDDNTVKDFTLAKIYNGLVVSSMYHPLLKRVTIPPLTRAFEELADLYPL